MSRLALGTVQFGLDYGVANRQGQVPLAEVQAILEYAESLGMDTLDTAIAYGNSEERLGEIGVGQWRVISKLPALPIGCADIGQWVRQSVDESLGRLHVSYLHGLLLHRPEQLLGTHGDALYAALRQLVADGLVRKIGVSIYDPADFFRLGNHFDFDIVQLPFNILDRRLIDSGLCQRLIPEGVEIHARSVFLQGLLLMRSADRPPQFRRWQPLWQRWQSWLAEARLSPLQACIRYVLSFPGIAKVVVGVDSVAHLKEIAMAAEGERPELPAELNCTDLELINPSRWPKS